jgi:TonB family protein
MANETPAPCSGALPGGGACVRLIYTVAEAGVSCEWVVLLKADGSDVTILDENDDAAHYFLAKLSAAAAKQLVLSNPQPVYPPIAKAAGVQGSVKLQIFVRADGKTSVGTVTGPPMLTGAAADAARDWKFKPLQIGNRTVPFQTEIVIRFGISGMNTGIGADVP